MKCSKIYISLLRPWQKMGKGKSTNGVRIYFRKILCHCSLMFIKLQEFATYLRTFWLPLAEVLSVFQRPVRINNSCENFHLQAKKTIGSRSNIFKMLGNYIFDKIDKTLALMLMTVKFASLVKSIQKRTVLDSYKTFD